jgi:RNA polymerase sigma-70 factor (ECF subfamily)
MMQQPGADQLARQQDVRLMESISRGDESALAQFYDRYSALVYAVCLRVLGQTADAEEATLDVFWEIWEKPHRYDQQRGSVLSYLLVLARSRAIDRRRSRQGGANLHLEDQENEEQGHGSASIAAVSPDPVEDAWLNEQRAQVLAALDLLTDSQREALVLSFFEGMSHQQIAQQLGQPLGTIKTRIRQAIIRLRDGLCNLDGG